MAKIVRCANGHFYDSEKKKVCPYCQKINKEKIEIQKWEQDIPHFQYQTQTINDEITQAMPVYREKNIISLKDERASTLGIKASDEQLTQAIYKGHLGTGYVTGWLVCIKGPSKGRDYRIMHGMNWIGRGMNMDILINGDTEIAYDRHCAVVYDGKGNQFFIVQGQGALTYVNDEIVEETRKLELGDVIKIGKSTFEFIPFCREGHVWDAEKD